MREGRRVRSKHSNSVTKKYFILLLAGMLLAIPAQASAAAALALTENVEKPSRSKSIPSPKSLPSAVSFISQNSGVIRVAAAPIGPARPLVIAHRGASTTAPENTFAAFDHAVQNGADYIELDVQLSRDGVPFVLHDSTLDRTTNGQGVASHRTISELRGLDAGSWHSNKFKGERIPMLDEVLRRYGGQVGLLLELKDPQLQPGLERAVADALTRHNLTGEERLESSASNPAWRKAPVIVQSFGLPALRRFNDLLPSVPLCVIISRVEELEETRLHEMADFATYTNIRMKLAEPRYVRRIHSSGMAVMVWTIDRRRDAVKAVAAGADGIVTDDPHHFREWIKKSPSSTTSPSGTAPPSR
ncbi:glycerophosphoryl diester phosphodiesterase [Paenibacillaceae bacterium GAS479]|nr:glycerophosphoryl diester phosphodiesterase [Paenibacillaceae bacterium GAS479]